MLDSTTGHALCVEWTTFQRDNGGVHTFTCHIMAGKTGSEYEMSYRTLVW